MTWQEILKAFDIERYPSNARRPAGRPLTTNMNERFAMVFNEHGAEHFTMVCRVFAETHENNAFAITSHIFLAVSDALATRRGREPEALEQFDAVDLLAIDRMVDRSSHARKREFALALIEVALAQQAASPVSVLACCDEMAAALRAETERRGILLAGPYSGVSAAAKALGIPECEALDAVEIAGLSEEVRSEVLALRMHNDRRVLLRVAKMRRVADQIVAVRQAAARRRLRSRSDYPGSTRLVA